jgi:hypothetical protein
MPGPSHLTDRARRGALTAAVAAGGLAIHLAVQRLAPPPIVRAGEALVSLFPFLPWTVWIYLLFFPLLVLTGALVEASRWRRLFLAWAMASVTSWILICLVPVSFHRPDPGAIAGSLHAWVYRTMYRADPAHVTFPCLHSAITWISWSALRHRGARWNAGLLVLATAITLATMTTRQHLVTDNAAGLMIAWASARVALGPTIGPDAARVNHAGRAGREPGSQ